MAWFHRDKEGILTLTEEKRETPDGLWLKCPGCKKSLHVRAVEENNFTCTDCHHHFKIGSEEYFGILFDDKKYKELNAEMEATDFLKFVDTKKYSDRLKESQKKTGLKDALRSAYGKVTGHDIVVCAMDFDFIGGSMGSVVGEKILHAIDFCLKKKFPLLIISKSGGARMMESAVSLMQLAKTSAKLSQLLKVKVPYISLMTNPTTGGVTASFAMLGDFNIAEPGALIGFAGPRVIRQTIGKDLPEGFQSSEFLLEHGFLDFIVHRKELKQKIAALLKLLKN